MKSRLIRKFAQSQKYRIVCALKRNGPMSVPDLLQGIRLSYMGVKQHCLEMERDGYVVKKRKPKTSGRGRPEVMYELTAAASELFPSHDTPLTCHIMAALRQLYGANAPEKVLFTIYQDKILLYRKKISSLLPDERLQDFIRLREKEGYLITWNPAAQSPSAFWSVTECHSPIASLLGDFPILLNFELQLYQKTLSPHVRRTHHTLSPYRVTYEIPKK